MLDKLNLSVTGRWVDPEGCSWETKADYMFCGILPSCGCGDPESIGQYVYDMLVAHVRINDSEPWDHNSYDDLSTMFFLSWADNEGYIEHGTTIRCSWITDLGRELLKDLEEVLKK